MNESERDRRVDAAWSAASREEPPAALDAAIRAAARRAVAAPKGGRGKHWWYPLAAAATVAVLAVGIAQLTPPERVAPPSISDVASALRDSRQEAAPTAAAVEAPVAAPQAAAPSAAPGREAQAGGTPPPGAAAGTLARERARGVAAQALQKPAVTAPAESPPPSQVAGAATDKAAANTAASAPAFTPAPPATAAAAPPTAPRAEPFPAATPAEVRRDGYRQERDLVENAPVVATNEPGAAPSRASAAKVARADELKVKDASARSAEDWIKRIRDLRNEGRLDEAAKELAMFRSAYGERADALLPADLRQIKR